MSEKSNDYLAPHYVQRSSWIRAAVLGANDGILSTSSLAIGVAAAGNSRDPLVVATVAGLIAGALSMAAGEYVSVSSQKDIEIADIRREQQELIDMPEIEQARLAEIYEKRGLKKETALLVARELTEHDALGAHLRDELGINEITKAKPLQAAIASAASFILGGILPFLITLFSSMEKMELVLYVSSILFLAILGGLAARTGGSNVKMAILRVTLGGTAAMGLTALVGYIFGVNL